MTHSLAPQSPTRGTVRHRRPLVLLLCGLLVVSLSGCLGTIVEAPTASTPSPAYAVLRVHLVAAPRVIRANECKKGVSEVATYVPLWGLAIGIVTFGIVVPQWTLYSCVDAG